MTEQPLASPPTAVRRFPLRPAILLAAALGACSVYANLSFPVTDPADYRFFPPFQPGVNANDNQHLGPESINMARSLVAGEGFAHPFYERTGPTAWMPPALPTLLAGILWVADGDKDVVMTIVVCLQVYALVVTGILVLALARQTTGTVGTWVTAAVFFLAVLCDFRLWFQFTHDHWLILLAADLLIAGHCWSRPLGTKKAAAGWGLFGGACALASPVVGLCWGVFAVLDAVRQRAWPQLALAVLAAAMVLAPWTVRNYLTFGRLIPVKSNLAYELYQSQCLQRDGLLESSTFKTHPIAAAEGSRREYKALGETAFLQGKSKLFWASVRADPWDFLDRVACRFLGATLWYVPLDRDEEVRRPWVFWLGRLSYPLPFVGLLVLIATAVWQRLSWAQGTVLVVYLVYLFPYIVISYYERYALPLLGAKVMLVIWGTDRLLSFRPRGRTGSEPSVPAGGAGVGGPCFEQPLTEDARLFWRGTPCR